MNTEFTPAQQELLYRRLVTRNEKQRTDDFWTELSRRVPELLEGFARLQNFQAERTPPFGPTPLEYLTYFEGIENEVLKQHFWSLHKEEIQLGMRARDWQLQKDAAQKILDQQTRDVGLYSQELAKITDPGLKATFLKEHRAEIESEVLAVQQEATRIRLDQTMSPATL